MLRLSVETLVELTGGELISGTPETMINGLAIDSREVEPGSAFVAFVGERTDGHRFVPDALDRGARVVVVTRDADEVREAVAAHGRGETALVAVDDAYAAIEALAAWHRDRLTCPVIGITGSTGKTTTKDFVRSVLGTTMRVVATSGNRNNELGVPLTVMDAGADTEALVVEMAMRGAGQIAHLCDVARPTAGLVTNVGVSHMEVLGSQEAIASAKGELVQAIPADGQVFVNGDDAWSATLAATASAEVITYGLGSDADITACDVVVTPAGMPSFTLAMPEGAAGVTLAVPGKHNVYNALAAAAVGRYLGVPLIEIVRGLEGATFSRWRMETFVSASGVTVINDAYNANPTSMRAAIGALQDLPTRGRRIAVLGDMAELGTLTELAHFELGEEVARSAVDVLVSVGELGRRIADGAKAAGMPEDVVRPCANADEASEVIDDVVEPGDTVLVKASRVMGLETVVEGMMDPRVQPAS
ncbi:UDP-N-acetylmuramoyl-tripeptide--D-alanyl-D-alanine ligase [Anaerosoma tenue]|uniref:UDP-N-acetylmuramoyl-tripeptide--D-alanyl-D- alanine ligase n=1 Tax=Anaerosoma tenue TaxID=2933588 RepID=UPI002260B1A0|nr:UDP-N-acetylmuramoyl-tripeptide--D-alanyl-D-alanine ligase [Anaerosoma tenue]MCK8114371.1 UDP-N-acetylmuramoyl-tripeptide--D-alanyl-D-alanine ligase [Anaerosoma tenue]